MLQDKSPYLQFRHITVILFKIAFAFLALYSAAYFILVPLAGLAEGIGDPWACFFYVMIGVAVVVILVFFYGIAHTRIGALLTVIGFGYWWLVPGKNFLGSNGMLEHGFVNAWITMNLAWLALAVTAALGLFTFLAETINLMLHGKSWLAGPWFKALWTGGRPWIIPRLDGHQKRAILKTVVALCVAVGLAIPSFAALFDVYSPTIEIYPLHYNITYNFWATPGIYDNYSAAMQAKYGLGPRVYSDAALDQFDKYHVNLDLTFGTFTNASLATLVQWETRCPHITYRIVLTPQPNIKNFVQQVENATDLLMAWEANGTIHGWLGFCFDIEGDQFNFRNASLTFAQSTAIWNDIFNFIDQKSAIRHRQIEMECVSTLTECEDVPFDGDADLQAQEGFNEYTPDRFTTYAPMIYRCWYGGNIPWGLGGWNPNHPWSTSYNVYSQLLVLTQCVHNKAGFYIGITNTSCYARDLPQPESYTWPTNTTNTGFYNLMRDILIAKSFGIKQITFFLAWTAIERNYSMGGVFDSYGSNFLDVVNQTVNTNPPDHFSIYYSQTNAVTGESLQFDWELDTNRILGQTEMIAFWIAAILIAVVIPAFLKSRKRNLNPSRTMEKTPY